jgi:predicted RNase H-like nuclease (RuvC/YqgF family)
MLALVIHSGTWDARFLRTRWSDAKIQRIENMIPDFVAGLMRTAVVLRQKEEERKRQELEQQKRAQELVQLQKDIEEEEKKLEQLNRWLENWDCAERLRRFIEVYAEKSQSWPAEKQLKSREWIGWATREAHRLDPFVLEKPSSVLDRKHELRWR